MGLLLDVAVLVKKVCLKNDLLLDLISSHQGFVDAMAQANVKPSKTWWFGGEFNETPDDSLMAETVEALEGRLSSLNRPTRLQGHREIIVGLLKVLLCLYRSCFWQSARRVRYSSLSFLAATFS